MCSINQEVSIMLLRSAVFVVLVYLNGKVSIKLPGSCNYIHTLSKTAVYGRNSHVTSLKLTWAPTHLVFHLFLWTRIKEHNLRTQRLENIPGKALPGHFSQGSARPDLDHWDRDRNWKCLSPNNETETEKFSVSMTRPRLKMLKSQ